MSGRRRRASSTCSARRHSRLGATRPQSGKRVRRSGLYSHEVHKFEVASHVHRRVALKLGLTDLGTLTTPESRNVVRKVRQPDGSAAVLKVIGNLREPGEAEVLRLWGSQQVTCF